MTMDVTSKVEELLSEVRQRSQEAHQLQDKANRNSDEEQRKAFKQVAKKLDELDDRLVQSVFVNNNDKIQKLVSEVKQNTAAGQEINEALKRIAQAVAALRVKVTGVNAYIDDAKALSDKVDELVELVTGA